MTVLHKYITSQWCYARDMASQITGNSTVVFRLNKDDIKAQHYWPFVRGIHRYLIIIIIIIIIIVFIIIITTIITIIIIIFNYHHNYHHYFSLLLSLLLLSLLCVFVIMIIIIIIIIIIIFIIIVVVLVVVISIIIIIIMSFVIITIIIIILGILNHQCMWTYYYKIRWDFAMMWQIAAFKYIFNWYLHPDIYSSMEYSITWRHKLCRAFTLDALASRPVACCYIDCNHQYFHNTYRHAHCWSPSILLVALVLTMPVRMIPV